MATIFQNSQWSVSEQGIESRHHAPIYRIPAERLLETHGGRYYWPGHMAEKPWVISSAFNEAYEAALKALRPDFDEKSLSAAIEESRKLKA